MNRLEKDVRIIKFNTEEKPRVFVCGGGSPVSKEYYEDAYKVGKILAELGTAYVQGGLSDRETMMGESYHGYKDAGGDSSYFISRKFGTEDIMKDVPDLKGACEVEDIASLIKNQYLWSDAVVILPGGTGTLIEMLGYIEQAYDYPDKKPSVIVFNKNGFFNGIFNQIKNSQEIGFISHPVIEENFIVVDTLGELEEQLSSAIKEKNIKR